MPSPAEMYEAHFVPHVARPWARALLELATPKRGDHVLDVACGTGVVAREVATMVGRSGRVVGSDLRPGMLETARALPAPEGATIEWRQDDATDLGLPDSSFDMVTCQLGLQFFADRPAALSEFHRVLKNGGRVAVTVWQSIDRMPLFAALAAAELRHLGELGITEEDTFAPFSLSDPGELAGLLAGAGFQGVSVAERSMEAHFPSIERFVHDTEYGYAGVIPEFVSNPKAFLEFVEAAEQDMVDLLEAHRQGDGLRFPLHANIATGHRPPSVLR